MSDAVLDADQVAELPEVLREADSHVFILQTPAPEEKIVYVSEEFSKKLGYSAAGLIGKSISELKSRPHESDDLLRLALNCGHELVSTTVIQDSQGNAHNTKVHQVPIPNNLGYIVVFAQIYDLADTTQDLECQAFLLERLLQEYLNGYKGISLKRARVLASIPHPKAYVVADPSLQDCPLVWCSPPFFEICGFSASECIGRNCRFLQGPDTDQMEVARLREAVIALTPISSCLLNYRTDGTLFWNHVYMLPILNSAGGRAYFVATQYDVTRFVENASDLMLEKDRAFEQDEALRNELLSLDEMQRDINTRMRDILLTPEEDLPLLPPPTTMQRMSSEPWEVLRRGGIVARPISGLAEASGDSEVGDSTGTGSVSAMNPKQAIRVARARREVARRLAKDWRGKGPGLANDAEDPDSGKVAGSAQTMSPLSGSSGGKTMSPLGGSSLSESKPTPMLSATAE